MKLYLCYIYVPTDDTPRMVTLTCEGEADIPRTVQETTAQWPQLSAVEVFENERRIWSSEVVPGSGAANENNKAIS